MSRAEFDLINWIAARQATAERVPCGIGDDAALLPPHAAPLVTVDMLMDGVDFRLGEVSPELIGRKALAVSLSDIAAMGGLPTTAFCALSLPRDGGLVLGQRVMAGLLALAEEFSVAVAGGDTNSWQGPLVISVTVIGEAPVGGPVLRSGAKAGDRLLVTGSLGGSIAGHHLTFTPRLQEASCLLELVRPTSMIDLSDGLAGDLRHVCAASHVGVELWASKIPLSAALQGIPAPGATPARSAIHHALGDGEDFELLFTVPPGQVARLLEQWDLSVPLTEIGVMTADPALWLVDEHGRRELLPELGWTHELT